MGMTSEWSYTLVTSIEADQSYEYVYTSETKLHRQRLKIKKAGLSRTSFFCGISYIFVFSCDRGTSEKDLRWMKL